MKVSDLIEALEKLPPDMEVFNYWDENIEFFPAKGPLKLTEKIIREKMITNRIIWTIYRKGNKNNIGKPKTVCVLK